jgi:hypothetical protein
MKKKKKKKKKAKRRNGGRAVVRRRELKDQCLIRGIGGNMTLYREESKISL